ncbi:MAG: hypothetical protein K2H85_10185 [Allobaculum sp.]|nr:hypothetical protein [Allobaculum sp.]
MNIDPNSSDKTKWGDFAIALQQIEQFYHYLHSIIPDFQDKCKGLRIVPFIGIKLPPNLNKKTNTQRWNEIVTFSTATHLKIRFGEELDPLNI